MRAHQAEFRIATMARVLGVSPSGYYAWRHRERSARERSDEALSACVREIHQRSRGTYGAPHIHAELAAEGTQVGRKRVARVMREAGLSGVSRRKGPRTTRRDPKARPAPDLVERRFDADDPDRLWVADITYVPTAAGFVYQPWCSTCSAAAWWTGPWPITCAPNWCSQRWTWHWDNDARTRSFIIPTRLPVHLVRLRRALPPSGRRPLDGLGRGLL